MNIKLPDSLSQVIPYLRDLNKLLSREFSSRPAVTTVHSQLLLASPDGKVYSVVVANDGSLSTEQVST